MAKTEECTIVNIRDYLQNGNDSEIGEDVLQDILSDYSCPQNEDVEHFLKANAVEFTKKHQSVTYLVLSNEDGYLLGYFSLTIKLITVEVEDFSVSIQRKIARVSEPIGDGTKHRAVAYLIAQLGKNYTNHADQRITGRQLLEYAIQKIYELQYLAGGMLFFVEAEDTPKLMRFYEEQNHFKRFDVKETSGTEPHKLVQLLRTL